MKRGKSWFLQISKKIISMQVPALVAIGILLASCGSTNTMSSAEYNLKPSGQNYPYSQRDNIEYMTDEVIVKLREGFDAKTQGRVLAQITGGRVIETAGSYVLIRLPQGVSIQSAVERLRNQPSVKLVGPNGRIPSPPPPPPSPPPSPSPGNGVIPNDPSFSSQWNMLKIEAPRAWSSSIGSRSIVVAVLDTGVKYDHLDLADNMWRNPNDCDGDGVDDDNNGYIDDCHGMNAVANNGDPMDDRGHGTHVAGIIGATGNNGLAVAGVNWEVSVLACKFLDSSGYGTLFDELQCIDYIKTLKDRGVNIVVVNGSYGYSAYSPDALERDAINDLKQRGILFVASAGNNARDNDGPMKNYPCALSIELDNLICVASTDQNDALSSFSNYGLNTVQVAAPGRNILSTYTLWSTYALSGTSMAAPHVTGLVALIKAVAPSFNYLDVKNRILSSVDILQPLVGKVSTGGRINAYRAITGLSTVYTLTVNKTGNGSGTVISSPSGINCGSICSAVFNSASVVTLTASPSAGSQFDGWGGDCSSCGTNTTCSVTMNSSKTCIASFSDTNSQPPPPPPPAYTLTIYKAGTGSGTVTSNPAGINCGSTCSASFQPSILVTLTALPNTGSVFAGWGGACSACLGSTCVVTMDTHKSCTVIFNLGWRR